jgi:hypothetical protein
MAFGPEWFVVAALVLVVLLGFAVAVRFGGPAADRPARPVRPILSQLPGWSSSAHRHGLDTRGVIANVFRSAGPTPSRTGRAGPTLGGVCAAARRAIR